LLLPRALVAKSVERFAEQNVRAKSKALCTSRKNAKWAEQILLSALFSSEKRRFFGCKPKASALASQRKWGAVVRSTSRAAFFCPLPRGSGNIFFFIVLCAVQ